jgi:hypothetical protein
VAGIDIIQKLSDHLWGVTKGVMNRCYRWSHDHPHGWNVGRERIRFLLDIADKLLDRYHFASLLEYDLFKTD